MVLYEDNHLLVVYKPTGLLVQGDKTGDETVLDYYKSYIKEMYNKPGAVYLHPAHRLDRPVSGCLILIRTSKALSRMTTAFREGKVQKMYHALCGKKSSHPEGLITHYLRKDGSKNKSSIVKGSSKGAKKSQLNFSLSGAWRDKFLYRVHPLTGRSHQIRVQLSSIGSPILGDVKYGGIKVENDRMIYLHCSAMGFEHPVKKIPIYVSVPPPEEDQWSNTKDFIMNDILDWEADILG